jgi:hypothetical protein
MTTALRQKACFTISLFLALQGLNCKSWGRFWEWEKKDDQTATYTIAGTVSGLTGTGLVLQNNGTDSLSITADGSFTFSTPIADGSTYNVTVLT